MSDLILENGIIIKEENLPVLRDLKAWGILPAEFKGATKFLDKKSNQDDWANWDSKNLEEKYRIG